MTNKEISLAFLKMASSGQVLEAYDRFVHPSFIHHNPWFPGDRASLMQGMIENHRQFPLKEFTPLRAIEEGDLVAVHGKVRLEPNGQDIALIHIFRFKEGKIVEEWEGAVQSPAESPNKLGLF